MRMANRTPGPPARHARQSRRNQAQSVAIGNHRHAQERGEQARILALNLRALYTSLVPHLNEYEPRILVRASYTSCRRYTTRIRGSYVLQCTGVLGCLYGRGGVSWTLGACVCVCSGERRRCYPSGSGRVWVRIWGWG